MAVLKAFGHGRTEADYPADRVWISDDTDLGTGRASGPQGRGLRSCRSSGSFQSLWATELRRPGIPERPVAERFDQVKEAGFHGMAIDCGALNFDEARAVVPEYARTGLEGLLVAFPRSIEDLRPAIHLAKDIDAPFVVVVGQVMPVRVADMIPVIEGWLRIADEEGMPIQFETHAQLHHERSARHAAIA